MKAWTFDSRDPEDTHAAGCALGRAIGADGLVVALIGPLGAGKTVFVKGLAEGLGVDPRVVSSPTFVIAQQYVVPEGPECLHHVDLYRLESEDELEAIGFDEMFAPGAVLAAEWADRFPGVLGSEFLSVVLEGPSAGGSESELDGDAATAARPAIGEASGAPVRRASVTAHGEAAQTILADWSARFDAREGSGGSRPGAGGFVEMRLGVWLCLAVLLWLGSSLPDASAPALPCALGRSLERDGLGTSRVDCAPEAGLERGARLEQRARLERSARLEQSARFEQGLPVGLEGVARWLVGERVDVNKASRGLLETLPGIGPVRAEAIVRERERRRFARLAELERVHGIGPKTVRRLSQWLDVGLRDEAGSSALDAGGERG